MATIQNKTARALLYSWHSGQWSPFYAAASSGLVESFAELVDECSRIGEPDRAKLMAWIQKRQSRRAELIIGGSTYSVLPWAKSRVKP